MILKWAFGFALFFVQARAQEKSLSDYLLGNSLKFFSQFVRDPVTGQYCDAITINPKTDSHCNDPHVTNPDANERKSSVAATGMGLVALTLADQLGSSTEAYAQISQSLKFLVGDGQIDGRAYPQPRSKSGWYRHYYDLRTGANNAASGADGYSTVDTAILAAAAQISANYFEQNHRDPGGALRKLADRLLLSIDWSSAVADLQQGKLYLNFKLDSEKPPEGMQPTTVYNEYVLVACMGRVAETKRDAPGVMTQFWDMNYANGDHLPRRTYKDVGLFTDNPGHFVSSFVSQFAVYLCGDVGKSEVYLQNLKNAQKADRDWFAMTKPGTRAWGLGAGETRHRITPTDIRSGYHADAIDDNPNLTASPHIVAGFLPVYPEGIDDLKWMVENRKCFYQYGGLDLLWRCNLEDPDLKIDTVQAVDFSTMIIGLSTLDPRVGLKWFQKYAASGDQAIRVAAPLAVTNGP